MFGEEFKDQIASGPGAALARGKPVEAAQEAVSDLLGTGARQKARSDRIRQELVESLIQPANPRTVQSMTSRPAPSVAGQEWRDLIERLGRAPWAVTPQANEVVGVR